MRRLGTLVLALLLCAAFAQTAIESVDDLVAAFASGGEYRIAPGTYALDGSLDVAGALSIVGSGPDDVTIEASGGPIAVRVGEGARLHLEGLRLVWAGDSAGDLVVVRNGHVVLRGVDLGLAKAGTVEPADPWRPAGHGTALVLQGRAEADVEDTRIIRNENAAIEVLGTSALRLATSQVGDNHRGIIAVQEARIDVRGSTFLDQFAQAIVLLDDAQATLTDSGFGGNGVLDVERGMWLEAIRVVDQARATFRGGIVRDSPVSAIAASGTAEVVIDGTLLEANGDGLEDGSRRWAAVVVMDEARVAVQRATVRGSLGGAFEVRQAGTLVIEDSTVAANGAFGHTRVSDQGTLVIQGSRFLGNEGSVFVHGDARAAIHGSELLDGASSGVTIGEAASVDIVGNTIAGHVARGVWIDGDASADLTDNTITGNEMGLWMTGAATAFVTENRVFDNLHSGAVLLGGTRAVFMRNEITGNGRNGVALADESGGHLEDNRLLGNGQVGVLIVDAATGTLEGNTIAGSESGVRLEDQGAAQGVDNVFSDNGQNVTEAR
ncbi:MAG: right-handed parallel beta-helix repeat-containing protein [Trueperaceae bacterium]|nr:MAG: right-handed parallel beta-helix repeat-containing protein [Trueperaceae bacterium]